MGQERTPSLRQKIVSGVEKATDNTAEFIGQTAGNTFVDFLRRRVANFDLEVTGQENIRSQEDRPFILVANHLKTRGLVFGQRDINITPDAFILERTIKELTTRQPQIVASSDFGFQWHESPASKTIQKKVENWRDVVLTGAGFITIKRGEGTVNLKLFRQVKKALVQNTPIIIFPRGSIDWDQDQSVSLKDGVAILAKSNKVPIIAARIDGATSWSPKSPVTIKFKEQILPDRHIEEIMRLVKSGISTR